MNDCKQINHHKINFTIDDLSVELLLELRESRRQGLISKGDIEDLIRAGICKISDFPKDCVEILGKTFARRNNTMICDIVESSMHQPIIKMSQEVEYATTTLKNFMLEVFNKGEILENNNRAKHVIERLYEYYFKNPDKLPVKRRERLEADDLHIVVCDHITNMTDKVTISTYKKIEPNSNYIPLNWTM